MILLHYLAHEFILSAHFIHSFATFQHPYVQFVMTKRGTKRAGTHGYRRGNPAAPALPTEWESSSPAHTKRDSEVREEQSDKGTRGRIPHTMGCRFAASPGGTAAATGRRMYGSQSSLKAAEIPAGKQAPFQRPEEQRRLFTLHQHLL